MLVNVPGMSSDRRCCDPLSRNISDALYQASSRSRKVDVLNKTSPRLTKPTNEQENLRETYPRPSHVPHDRVTRRMKGLWVAAATVTRREQGNRTVDISFSAGELPRAAALACKCDPGAHAKVMHAWACGRSLGRAGQWRHGRIEQK